MSGVAVERVVVQKDWLTVRTGPLRAPGFGSPPAGALVERNRLGPLVGGHLQDEPDATLGRPLPYLVEQRGSEPSAARCGSDEQPTDLGDARTVTVTVATVTINSLHHHVTDDPALIRHRNPSAQES